MKKIALITISIVFLSTIAFAEWEAVTKDDEVMSKEMVQVKETIQLQTDRVFTLKHVNNKIAALEAELTEWKAIRDAIEPVADAVKLKVVK